MNKFVFKQAALLGRGAPGHRSSVGKTFSRGVHMVEKKWQEDPTFIFFAKGGLIVPFKEADAPKELEPASSDIAKGSAAAAKASQIEPDAEIGGESDEHHGKGKKSKKER